MWLHPIRRGEDPNEYAHLLFWYYTYRPSSRPGGREGKAQVRKKTTTLPHEFLLRLLEPVDIEQARRLTRSEESD
jgi:hypothetical protein